MKLAAETENEPDRARIRSFPFVDLQAQFETIREEVRLAVERVLESQQFILGPDVQELETDLSGFLGTGYALGCASGSDALLLALLALGIGPGDEVITTPFTFVATAGAIARVGAQPVFVDIDPQTYNLDPKHIARAITTRTRGVLPVHLFGQMAPMDAICEATESRRTPVIEDAAQAIGAEDHGRPAGTIGCIGCFSFFPSKNLGGAGDGRMVATNDPELAERIKMLRVHGSRKKYHHEILGVNSRLDTLQAAILRVKLRHLPEWTLRRRDRAARYRLLSREAGLEGSVQLPGERPELLHVYNQFVIRTRLRDEMRSYLQDQGIPTEIYYPLPLHLQPAFAYLGYQRGAFPNSEVASAEVLALPIYPELTNLNKRRSFAP